ncbi:unnamed protein product [Rotaria socialis]|nr:unnamed protein product [Rotaria socialis]
MNIFLVIDVQSSLFNDNQIANISMRECKICFEELPAESLFCCSSSICSKCIYHHLTTNINEARIRIICPSCPHIGNIRERYKRLYADQNREVHIKRVLVVVQLKKLTNVYLKEFDGKSSCDRRRFGIKFLGSHDSRFYPDKPLVRHTARGLVVGAASLEISVAAVGTTIGSPTYGTYRLIKHIRSKRYERLQRYRMETIARQWNTSDSLIADGQIIGSDDIRRAAQVSLMTYREEIAGREQREVTSYPTRHPSHSNQDDDSFDH